MPFPALLHSLAFAALLGGALAEPALAAKPTEDKATVEARKHIGKAKVHYKLGEFEEAVTEFKEAYRLKTVPAILFNIAQAYRMVENYRQSKFYYQNYMRDLPNAPNKGEVLQQIDELEKLIAAAGPAPKSVVAPPAAGPPEPAKPPLAQTEPVVLVVKPEPPKTAENETMPPLPPEAVTPLDLSVVEEESGSVLPIILGAASAVLAIAGAVTYGLARGDWTDATAQERPRTDVDALISSGDSKRAAAIGLGGAAAAAGLGAAVVFAF